MAPNISSRCMVPTRVMCIYPHEIRRNTTVAIVMEFCGRAHPKQAVVYMNAKLRHCLRSTKWKEGVHHPLLVGLM
jgi:hypothetical protein